ncbi:MAG: deoxyguanosinetriphosphate triphosphohydrolase [Halarsenatibacteraceae bacterium]
MFTRKDLEKKEVENLSQRAQLSSESKGRRVEEELCKYRMIFQQDRDRIIHSKTFRRLKHKTQVFISPMGDHFRTRLTHTLEVSQISRTIARALGLNEDLTEAIALAHDLGHTPFGHAGEEVLNRLSGKGFQHNRQSLRVVDKLESRNGGQAGLNLSYEVRDGILNHTGEQLPDTLEGQIVKIADRIAYINHDLDDAMRADIICLEDIPDKCIDVLGKRQSDRIDIMVKDIIVTSSQSEIIEMSDRIDKVTNKLRDYLFSNVYIGSKAKVEEEKAQKLLEKLYYYYFENPKLMPAEFYDRIIEEDKEQAVIDYIAGMTDRYAINQGRELFIPSSSLF